MNQPNLSTDTSTVGWLLFFATVVAFVFAAASAIKSRRLLENERLEAKAADAARRGSTLSRWQKSGIRLEDLGGLGTLREEINIQISELNAAANKSFPAPKAILIAGPPDTGKTSLALAIVHSLKREVCQVNCALLLRAPDQIDSLFHEARERNTAVVVLLDDLDFIGRTQGTNYGYTDDNRTRSLLTLLEQIDRLSEDVLVLGTAERIDLLDTALTRPGRFEKAYEMHFPNANARYDILQRLCERHKIHCQSEVLKEIAQGTGRDVAGGTNGFSGADLEALIHRVARGARDRTKSAHKEDWVAAIRDIQSLVTRRSANQQGDPITRSLVNLAHESCITLNSIGGLTAIKAELGLLAHALEHWVELKQKGCELPKGVLLAGPPGVGKTTLARALAGSAGVPFYSMSAAEFIEVFVGVGAARVRDTFRLAKLQAPSVLFIDEIDALGSRESPEVGSERHQTLNQLLVELDGCQPKNGVLVIAATNAISKVDPALLRPGRFDYIMEVSEPGEHDKVAIFEKRLRAADCVSKDKIRELISSGRLTTGAHVDGLFRIARFYSFAKGDGGQVNDAHFDHALKHIHSVTSSRKVPQPSPSQDSTQRNLEPALFLRRKATSQ